MESLNLHTLASSLPKENPANLQNAEKELLNNFKAAALSITTLYRSSRHTSKRAYNAGYSAACQDLLMMIQQGVSVGGMSGGHDAESGGMTIGRIMDWIEARTDAIKSREEEEDEDEEKERERATTTRTKAVTTPAAPQPSHQPVASTSALPKEPSLPTPHSPHRQTPPSQPSSPSPPPMTLPPVLRSMRPRRDLRDRDRDVEPVDKAASPASTFTGPSELENTASAIIPITGSKRRHAVMMLDPAPSESSVASQASSGASRRRTRGTRNQQQQNQNAHILMQNQAVMEAMMDVEDDSGRERKRVARR